ncbi:MAG: cadmium-translocating P-type ATPase [Oscillospiraceae bacterium]|nr:cadmium-translocating P-type ATPase [Oscillospiraceae bacterium]
MDKKQKIVFFRIIISFILFVTANLLSLDKWVRLIAFLIPYTIIGWDIIYKSLRNILKGKVFDENLLMFVATVGALFLGEYPEAVMVMLLYQIGELFQSYAIGRSRKSISSLMDIRPDYANLKINDEIKKVSPNEVKIGELIVIKPGEKIPLDGLIEVGSSSINTSSITGESIPQDVIPGDRVVSGCINMSGVLEVRVEKEFCESTVNKILDLIENSSSKKTNYENFITKFARYYTPFVVIFAALLAIVPPFLFGENLNDWVERALIFLVISCPCALVISVPLSFFGGIGGASRNGILIKGGNHLENLAKSSIMVFDKTGTLTRGIFDVTAIHPDVLTQSELLEITALTESHINHPISKSIKKAYDKDIDESRVTEVEEILGRGVKALIDGKQSYVGNAELMRDIGIDYEDCNMVGTIVHVAFDGKYAGHIVISDEIKPDARKSIELLKAEGIKKVVMLTGDSKIIGESVAYDLVVDSVYTNLLPIDKVSKVEELLKEKASNLKLAFVGDGINDVPVLSSADVGIAMGGIGSDAAIETADVVLMDDRLLKIPIAIKISKKTMNIVKQNIVFSLGTKSIILLLGALGLTNMWMAIFADVGVSIIAILNAFRTMYIKNLK